MFTCSWEGALGRAEEWVKHGYGPFMVVHLTQGGKGNVKPLKNNASVLVYELLSRNQKPSVNCEAVSCSSGYRIDVERCTRGQTHLLFTDNYWLYIILFRNGHQRLKKCWRSLCPKSVRRMTLMLLRGELDATRSDGARSLLEKEKRYLPSTPT